MDRYKYLVQYYFVIQKASKPKYVNWSLSGSRTVLFLISNAESVGEDCPRVSSAATHALTVITSIIPLGKKMLGIHSTFFQTKRPKSSEVSTDPPRSGPTSCANPFFLLSSALCCAVLCIRVSGSCSPRRRRIREPRPVLERAVTVGRTPARARI